MAKELELLGDQEIAETKPGALKLTGVERVFHAKWGGEEKREQIVEKWRKILSVVLKTGVKRVSVDLSSQRAVYTQLLLELLREELAGDLAIEEIRLVEEKGELVKELKAVMEGVKKAGFRKGE